MSKDMLRIGYEKIPILSGYLHDAGLQFGDIQFDENEHRLTITLNRIYYEEPKEGRFLFFIPVTRFRNIESRMWLDNVEDITHEWQDDAFSTSDSFHTLMHINMEDENTLELSTEYMVLRATLSKFDGVYLKDVSGPSKRYITTDFTNPVFDGLDELKSET